jgi:hypothetical protein
MKSDPIVAEIRAIREHRAARFNFEIRAVAKDAQDRDTYGDREVVRLPPRRPVGLSEKAAEATTKK